MTAKQLKLRANDAFAGQKYNDLVTKRAIILGNELVDIQHRQLVGLTKRLSESIAATDPQETPNGLLTELCSRLLAHDATEEEILQTRSPASYSIHKAAHARMATAAKSTAEGATNTQTAAQELARMAAELQGLVGQFKFGGSGSGAGTAGVLSAASPGRDARLAGQARTQSGVTPRIQ